MYEYFIEYYVRPFVLFVRICRGDAVCICAFNNDTLI